MQGGRGGVDSVLQATSKHSPPPPHPTPPHLQHEEEEYTQSIIDYFNTGLLSLPEGTTLRAYLAENLKW